MIRPLLSAACLAVLAACTPASDTAEHGVSTDPDGATGFITSHMVPPETATFRDGESVARDSDGRPYSYALLGQPLPALSGQMADGSMFDPAVLAGRWMVIDVWGIWCGDCMADAPYVAALVTAIEQDPDLGFLSIHTPANPNRATPEDMYGKYGSVAAYFAAKGYAYPTLLDEDASLRAALQISWTPSYLLVDPQGVVRGFRTDLSVAEGEPVKDFLKDVAAVKAQAAAAEPAAPVGASGIGPDGAGRLSGATPFNTNAIRAAFPGYEIVPGQMTAEGETYPVFHAVRAADEAPAFTIEPDWSRGQVHRVSTDNPAIAGPDGEQVGAFRLSQLDAAARALCMPSADEASDLLVCTEAHDGALFQRLFTPDKDATDATLSGMAYYPPEAERAD